MIPLPDSLLRPGLVCLGAAALGACAHPATDIKVDTMSMQQALASTQPAWQIQAATLGSGGAARADAVPDASPWVTAPTIALAYVYNWIDVQGNRHLGEWVAMAIQGFDWNPEAGQPHPRGGSNNPAIQVPDIRTTREGQP